MMCSFGHASAVANPRRASRDIVLRPTWLAQICNRLSHFPLLFVTCTFITMIILSKYIGYQILGQEWNLVLIRTQNPGELKKWVSNSPISLCWKEHLDTGTGGTSQHQGEVALFQPDHLIFPHPQESFELEFQTSQTNGSHRTTGKQFETHQLCLFKSFSIGTSKSSAGAMPPCRDSITM